MANASKSVVEALAFLRELGTVEELGAGMGRLGGSLALPVNSHIHLPPNFSAFTSVRQALDLAANQDIGVLGVSNYYDYEVYADFADGARRRGIFPLFGLEIIALIDELVKGGIKINDPGNPGKIYLCGKGITRFAPFSSFSAEAERLIGIIRRNDALRMRQMIGRLEAVFAERGASTGLTEEAVIDMVVKRHECPRQRVYLQERHICQAFQEAFFRQVPAERRNEKLTLVLGKSGNWQLATGNSIQNEIRSQLMKAGKPAFVPETFISFEDAYRLVLELGGIPCYPTLADGTSPICPFEEPVEKLIDGLKAREIWCAEFIPIRNTPEVLSRYVKAMRQAGLVVTAGTEHNTLDLLPLEPKCVGGKEVPEEIKGIFWEGACVVAGHQFANLHGRCGYVDGDGRPNPEFGDGEERIGYFSELGAAVIRRYRQKTG